MRVFGWRTPARIKGAFTLVELMVVVGIIALLTAMLLPALTKARDQARSVACRSNIRQIYTGIVHYSLDNRRFLPDAWYIMERQWVGKVWPRFLRYKLERYISTESKVWLCPGWPEDHTYDVTRLCVEGTPFSPKNLGEGYYFIPHASGFFWGNPVGGVWPGPWNPEVIRFGKPKFPDKAKVLSCMCAQQGPTTGMIGPHARGRLWHILWVTGEVTTSKGFWGSPPDFIVFVNSAGDWTPK